MNERQRRFVAEYRVSRNALQSAIRTGYSARYAGTIGWNLLRNPAIVAALGEAGVAITRGIHPRDQERKPRKPFVKTGLRFSSSVS